MKNRKVKTDPPNPLAAQPTEDVKQVIVIRKDLKMRRGKEIAQGSHASMATLTKYPNLPLIPRDVSWYREPRIGAMKQWLEGSFTKIVVYVNSEEELRSIHSKAVYADLEAHLIVDNGTTEFGGVKTPTALGIGPHFASQIDPITKDLPLY